MESSAQFSLIDDLHEALTGDKRDVILMQVITNVTGREPMGGWRELSPGDRTQAIYDEIRRLDQARENGTSALADRNVTFAKRWHDRWDCTEQSVLCG